MFKDKQFEEIAEMMTTYLARQQDERRENYRSLNKIAKKGQILFSGSSLMEQFPVNEICISKNISKIIYNRGIGGTTSESFLKHINTVLLDLEPSKIFINIGTNDIRRRDDGRQWLAVLMANYKEILRHCKEKLPQAKVYLMAYYPVNPDVPAAQNPMMQENFKVRTNEALKMANGKIKELAEEFSYEYIDANSGLTDSSGRLKEEFTIDGMHMFAPAYEIVMDNLMPYL